MKNLTKSEKRMVFLLVVFVVLAGSVQFGILPLFGWYSDMKVERDALVEDKAKLDEKLTPEKKAEVQQDYENAQAKMAEIITRYPVLMNPEDLQGILAELCTDCGFEIPPGLSLSRPADYKGDKASSFAVVTMNVTITGNYTAIQTLIDKTFKGDYRDNQTLTNVTGTEVTNATDFIHVNRISFSAQEAMRGPVSVSVFFEITMLKQQLQ